MAYTSDLPSTVTITNKLQKTDVFTHNLWNTGLAAAEGGDALSKDTLKLPKIGEEGYKIQIPLFGNQNLYKTLDAQEALKLTCTTDEEVLFYLAMAVPGVLTVEAASAV